MKSRIIWAILLPLLSIPSFLRAGCDLEIIPAASYSGPFCPGNQYDGTQEWTIRVYISQADLDTIAASVCYGSAPCTIYFDAEDLFLDWQSQSYDEADEPYNSVSYTNAYANSNYVLLGSYPGDGCIYNGIASHDFGRAQVVARDTAAALIEALAQGTCPTPTPSPTPTASPTPSPTPTASSTPTASPTASPTPTVSPTPTPCNGSNFWAPALEVECEACGGFPYGSPEMKTALWAEFDCYGNPTGQTYEPEDPCCDDTLPTPTATPTPTASPSPTITPTPTEPGATPTPVPTRTEDPCEPELVVGQWMDCEGEQKVFRWDYVNPCTHQLTGYFYPPNPCADDSPPTPTPNPTVTPSPTPSGTEATPTITPTGTPFGATPTPYVSCPWIWEAVETISCDCGEMVSLWRGGCDYDGDGYPDDVLEEWDVYLIDGVETIGDACAWLCLNGGGGVPPPAPTITPTSIPPTATPSPSPWATSTATPTVTPWATSTPGPTTTATPTPGPTVIGNAPNLGGCVMEANGGTVYGYCNPVTGTCWFPELYGYTMQISSGDVFIGPWKVEIRPDGSWNWDMRDSGITCGDQAESDAELDAEADENWTQGMAEDLGEGIGLGVQGVMHAVESSEIVAWVKERSLDLTPPAELIGIRLEATASRESTWIGIKSNDVPDFPPSVRRWIAILIGGFFVILVIFGIYQQLLRMGSQS